MQTCPGRSVPLDGRVCEQHQRTGVDADTDTDADADADADADPCGRILLDGSPRRKLSGDADRFA
jgi:hypothetical protein